MIRACLVLMAMLCSVVHAAPATQPAELAPVYVFLASNDASYVTGMVYGVTGGSLTS